MSELHVENFSLLIVKLLQDGETNRSNHHNVTSSIITALR
jgi:hypothetical protein